MIEQPRLLQPDEIDWALDLAQKCYSRQLGRDMWSQWVSHQMMNPCFRFLRGEHSFIVASVQRMLPDLEEIEGLFPYWMTDEHPHELASLFRHALVWMREMGTTIVWLKPTNGVDASPLASALGFEKSFPIFSMTLGRLH